MRLILVDRTEELRANFYPLTLNRPVWELRCGIRSLGERLISRLGIADVACLVPDYMAETYRAGAGQPVNDLKSLSGDDLLILDGRLKTEEIEFALDGPSRVHLDAQGHILYARISRADAGNLQHGSIDEFLRSLTAWVPTETCSPAKWNYTWDLILANAEHIASDFAKIGRSGIEGTIEEPCAIRGSRKDIYIAPGAVLHPMVVIDAENGPVYVDEGVQIHPFSRIEGPCYIGKGTTVLGAKCRAGNSIGPACRIGGEVEESIIQGYSNKYHDGFLGHAYVGEWVNLGAQTTNSDLKNDYSSVSVMLDGRRSIDTGSPKVGSLIGDHTKTSIGTLFNTGSYVGAMAIIMATGKPLPKFIPSFAWFIEGVVTKGFGKGKLYETAKTVVGRRGRQWSEADEAMWDAILEMTAPARDEAIKKGRRAMAR